MKRYIILILVFGISVNIASAVESSKSSPTSSYNTVYYEIPVKQSVKPSGSMHIISQERLQESAIPTKREFFKEQEKSGTLKTNKELKAPLYRLTDEDIENSK